jgi:hypothetical protein
MCRSLREILRAGLTVGIGLELPAGIIAKNAPRS